MDPKFSYRVFAKGAGIAPAYLKLVMDGKRNLSAEMSIRFGLGMALSEREVDYFENLVRFNQAHSLEEKSLYFERLRRQRAKTLKTLDMAEAARLLSHWYVVAIKELVVNLNSVDEKLIQKMLRKKLPETLIHKTIADLQEIGWLELVGGQWTSQASQIQFPDEVSSFVIRSFHHQMLEIAGEALEDDLAQREFQALVFTFSRSRFGALKEKIKDIQRELVAFIQEPGDDGQNIDEQKTVFYFGAQCFSLQKWNDDPSIHEGHQGVES